MNEQDQRKSPLRLAPRPSVLQHIPQKTIKKTKTRVSNACTACKARKTKCDNNKPKCTACSARPNSECVYFPFLDKRKRQHSQVDRDQKNREHDLLTRIFNATKYCHKEELPKLLEFIRGDATIEEIGEYVTEKFENNQHGYGTGSSESLLLGEDFEQNDTESEVSASRIIHRNPSSAMDIGNIVQISIPYVPSQPWTSVSTNDEFVSHLIQLYFTWEAPVYEIVEKDLFLADMRTCDIENSTYCSPLLVNAMLAAACLNSDREESWGDDRDSRTCGSHFFAEAERLWQQGPHNASLTKMQALVTMYYFEAHRANDGIGLSYFATAIDMYHELLSNHSDGIAPGPQPELAWPCWKLWTCRCFTALVLREPFTLATPGVPRPKIPEQVDLSDTWQPYPQLARSRPQRKIVLMYHCINLALIVQEMTLYLYSKNAAKPEQRGIIALHAKFQRWHDEYMSSVSLTDGRIGPDITIRLWYHAIEMHLFRGSLSDSAPTTPETSRIISSALHSAKASARLQKLYFRQFGARGTLPITYNSYQSSFFTLYFLDIGEYKEVFIEHVKMLWSLGKKRVISAFQLYTVGSIARMEGIVLPDEAVEILNDLEPARVVFEKRISTVPVPALSSKAAALRRFKEELLLDGQNMLSDSPVSPGNGKGKAPATDLFQESDPVLGSLTEFYQKMLYLD
ncbi:hypothetical protein H072_587 [Dactylellina haptotyla CBS 200.50]|uniref:Zn(2)-C6 fungal-type domain-containing protein n=1 Tax=Dactylellina haptotyla (strain CBS 200.50) TaxID=1284197 RepID=S8CCT5_DACHA|nr:hypothetical protein H072_587 [Dactylellina haptotyla CBS 200.50]